MAAGGAAFGLKAGLGGRTCHNLVKAWIGLDEKLSRADWVITGEGPSTSSLRGKAGALSGGNRQRQAAVGNGGQYWPNIGMPNSKGLLTKFLRQTFPFLRH